MAAHVLQRQIHAMIPGVHHHDVCMSSPNLAKFLKTLGAFGEDRHDAALRGNIQPVEAGIKGEDIRISANTLGIHDTFPPQIEGEQHGIPIACHERRPARSVDEEPVIVTATGQRIPGNDTLAGGVDFSELASGLAGHENVVRRGIILGVAGLSAQRTE